MGDSNIDIARATTCCRWCLMLSSYTIKNKGVVEIGFTCLELDN